ncbi:hypothetical protein CEXT_13411 [Caerostris extrusa]|uniref:Uncharacterized protein n=1 Tax=Caerostris extrusa TaxID=172846 RepID=A0AAV4YCI8_CAEEX|nr:hypothetical protein CEXT_13411 [Caerostris extrusa]
MERVSEFMHQFLTSSVSLETNHAKLKIFTQSSVTLHLMSAGQRARKIPHNPKIQPQGASTHNLLIHLRRSFHLTNLEMVFCSPLTQSRECQASRIPRGYDRLT